MQAVPPVLLGLPHISAVHSSVGVDAIGRGLRPLYARMLDAGVPAHLATLLARLDGAEPQSQAAEGMREAIQTFVVAVAATLGPSGIVVLLYALSQ